MKNARVTVVLSFSAFFAFLALKKSKFSKLYFLKVALKLFYVCSLKIKILAWCVSYGCFKFFFCIFSTEKIKNLKIVFSTGYLKIILCMFTKKFKAVAWKFVSYSCFKFFCFFAFLALKKLKFSKLHFLKVTLKLCYVCSQRNLRL